MSRDLPASIETMLQGTELTLARCIKFRLRDLNEFGLTDLDDDVEVPIPTVDDWTSLYQANPGMIGGDIDLAVGMESDSTEIKIPIGDLITRTAVLGKRFNQADIWVFDIDHSQAVPTPMEMMKGKITESRIEGNAAVFEVRSISDYWNIVIGSVLTPRCRADFADALCGMEKVETFVTVTAVESAMRFTVDFGVDAFADQYFRFGDLFFWDGPLAGLPPIEIVQSSAAGVIELIEPYPEPPEIGQELSLFRGCSRLKKSDDPTLPTCHSYLNLATNGGLRFRGFDRVPGSDVYLKMPIPGAAGA